jgi:hypothetical protein
MWTTHSSPISCKTDASAKYTINITTEGNKSPRKTQVSQTWDRHMYTVESTVSENRATQEIYTENLLCCTWYKKAIQPYLYRDSAASEASNIYKSKTWILGTAINNMTTALESKENSTLSVIPGVWEGQSVGDENTDTVRPSQKAKEDGAVQGKHVRVTC